MSTNCEKCSSQSPRAQSEVFKLFLSNQQFKSFTIINNKAEEHFTVNKLKPMHV